MLFQGNVLQSNWMENDEYTRDMLTLVLIESNETGWNVVLIEKKDIVVFVPLVMEVMLFQGNVLLELKTSNVLVTCYYRRQLDQVEQGGTEWNRMLIFRENALLFVH